jgi:hypothetical protein
MDNHEIDYAVGTPFRYVLRKLCTITGRSNWFFAHIANVLYPASFMSAWVIKKDVFLAIVVILSLFNATFSFFLIKFMTELQNSSGDTLSAETALLHSFAYKFQRLFDVSLGCFFSMLSLFEHVNLLLGAGFITSAATTYFMITHIPRGKGWLARSAAWLKHKLTELRPNSTQPGLSPA